MLFVLFTGMFDVLWLSILSPAMLSRTPPEGATIFVFCLALVLPALAATAALLWRPARWGDFLAPPLLIRGATIGLSARLGTLIGPAWGQTSAVSGTVTFAVFTLLLAALLAPWWRALAP